MFFGMIILSTILAVILILAWVTAKENNSDFAKGALLVITLPIILFMFGTSVWQWMQWIKGV